MNWTEILYTEPDQKLVLEIGANVKPLAQMIYPKDKIVTLDVDESQKPTIVGDAAKMPEELLGQLDGLFASHVLEHFSYWHTEDVLNGWKACLKPGGELHVCVPSWEWAAREVLSERPSPALLGHSFAGQVNQWDVHLMMFTMRNLRRLFEKIGLSVTKAKTGEYSISISGNIFKAEQHYICGVNGTPELTKE